MKVLFCRRAVPLYILAFVLLLAATMVAQQQTGDLLFKVSDPSGAVVAGAEITVTSPALIKPFQATTDAAGILRANSLPPGTYKATVKRSGFATIVRDNIKVEVGRTYPIEMALAVGAVTETLEVSSSTVQIDTVKSESSEVYGGDKLVSLPGQRDFADYVKLIPSVNNESMAVGISVDGASGAENVFFVDGVDTSDMYGGTNNQSVRPEIVQELQIKTGGYEAEFGGAMGGVVSVVTKSGGPQFHGQVYYYFNNSKLEGADRQTLRLNPDDERKAEYIAYPKDNFNRNEFGVSLGGPILKDKAWFFVNANPTFMNTERSTTLGGSNMKTVFTRHDMWRSGLVKLDMQPLQKIRLNASYTQDTNRWKGGLPDKRGDDNAAFPWASTGYKYPSYTFQGGMTATITPRFLIDTRYGFNGTDTVQLLPPWEPTYLFRTSPGMIGFSKDTPGYQPVGFMNHDPNTDGYLTAQDYQKKLNWNTTASFSFNALGQHNFKTGYSWQRWMWETLNAHPYDYLRLNYGRSWTTLDKVEHGSTCTGPNGEVYDGRLRDDNGNLTTDEELGTAVWCGYVEVRSPFGDMAKIHTDHNAFFFQDAWTIGRRLTVSPGIRFEKEEIPSFTTAAGYTEAPLKWGFKDKIAPRLGAAYDLFGNGKAKIFGSWGWFYDAMKLGLAEGSFGGFKWHSQYFLMNQQFIDALQDPKNILPPIGSSHPVDGFMKGCTGNVIGGGTVDCSGVTTMQGMEFLEDRDFRMPSFDSLDPNTKAMRMTNLTFGSEMELRKNYIFSATFVHKQLDRTIEDVGVLTPLGESFYITNPGYGLSVSEFVKGGMPPTPKAKRNYNALEFRLRKPFSNNWTGDFSYTYSRLRGNYSGLASSDEDWGTVDSNGNIEGRNDPNVERYFDFWYLNYDASGKLIDGPLNTDRPHQLKISGQYQLPHQLPAIGGFFQAMSGTPITRAVTFDNAEMYVNGRMSDGRTPFFTQTDLYFLQTFKPFKDEAKSIQFNVNIVNLFNQKTVTRKYRLMNRDTASLPAAMNGETLDPAFVQNFLKNGFDWKTALNEAGNLDPRFLMNQTYQGPVEVRFGIKFNF